jgi:Fic/DOC family protein
MTVTEYIVEEVDRQGHDVHILDGLERIGWMHNAWCWALTNIDRKPTADDAEKLGILIEPKKNWKGFRTTGVRVSHSDTKFPDFRQVPRFIEALFEQRDALSPVLFYREFQMIHPFVDGNGRTGKVLLNWLSGTLHNPEFPPSNLFGDPIRNP